MQIYPIELITKQAIEAAKLSSHAEKACPYPLDSPAAHIFYKTFEAARKPYDDAISLKAAVSIALKLATDLSVLVGEYSACS
jgi:hypothetical protein